MFKNILVKHKLKIFILTPILLTIIFLGYKVHTYPFKPKLFSADWFSNRFNGWQVEHSDLWPAILKEVVSGNTVIVEDDNGIQRTVDLIYVNTEYASPKTNKMYIDELNLYIGQRFFVKGKSSTTRNFGVLLDGNGENINLHLVNMPGGVINMSSTAYIHDRAKQLIPYYSNMNSTNRSY